MSVRLAIAAVIAGHAGLDQAGSVRRRQRVLVVAGVRREVQQRGRIRRPRRGAGAAGVAIEPRQRLADERAQRVLVHAPTSTWSMMPMIAASTAAAFLPSASPAALPSMTTRTFSPLPP